VGEEGRVSREKTNGRGIRNQLAVWVDVLGDGLERRGVAGV